MSKKILGWEIEEIKELIKLIKANKSNNLLQAFQEFAKNSGRKTFSVRNFYYRLIEEVKTNPFSRVELKKHNLLKELTTNHFTQQETKKLMLTLLNNEENLSLRQACKRLAKNNESELIRIQNKYRNTIKNDPELVKSLLKELQDKNIKTREVRFNNILSIPPQNSSSISKSEIDSLFWGLVNLIKKSAQQDAPKQLLDEVKKANLKLEKSLITLRKKEMLINELTEQNKILQEKLSKTQSNLLKTNQRITIKDLPLDLKTNKLNSLKSFIQSLLTAETQKKPQ